MDLSSTIRPAHLPAGTSWVAPSISLSVSLELIVKSLPATTATPAPRRRGGGDSCHRRPRRIWGAVAAAAAAPAGIEVNAVEPGWALGFLHRIFIYFFFKLFCSVESCHIIIQSAIVGLLLGSCCIIVDDRSQI